MRLAELLTSTGHTARLTGLDGVFLAGESRHSQMHTLKLVIIESPEGLPPVTAKTIREEMQRRLHALPCYTQKLRRIPFGLHHPILVGANDFNIENHVRVAQVPPPGGRRERDAIVSKICGGFLDRGRPLWELWVLEGLEGGRVGCLVKLHHALADGRVSANQLRAFADAPPAELVLDEVEPTQLDLVRDALADRIRDLRRLPALLRKTRRTIQATRAVRSSTTARIPKFSATPRTHFTQRMSDERSWGTRSIPLSEMSRVAKGHHVSINDVLVTMVATALRNYLAARGELPKRSLHAALPVDIRGPDDADALQGNKWSTVTATLATDLADIVDRLDAIHASLGAAKRIREVRGDLFGEWAQFLNLALFEWTAQTFLKSHLSSKMPLPIGISNVRGPESPVTFGEMKVSEFYSVGPLFQGTGLNVTAWSYAGQFNITLLSAQNLIPDPSEFLDHVVDALHELTERARDKYSSPASHHVGRDMIS